MKERDPEHDTDLDARIDDALRRRFRVPGETELRGLLPPCVAADVRPPGGGRWLPLVLTAAAAAALAVLLMRDEPAAPPEGLQETEPLGVADREPEPDPGLDPVVGPLVDGSQPLTRVQRPDLGALWEKAAVWTSAPGLRNCDDRGDVGALIAAALDQDLDLEEEASGVLQGPFSDESWPTGTILAGLADGQPSVLVAERDTVLACCLDLETPAAGNLQVFSWPVGDVVLTEITPHTEPRLLGLFTAYREPGRAMR